MVEFAGKGGMIHYAYQLCEALAEAGADVTLFTSRHYELEHLPHRFRAEPVLRLWDPKPGGEISTTPGLRAARRIRRAARATQYYREWSRLAATLNRERPDLVQFGDIRFATDVAPLALLKRSGLRLADICHNVRPFSAKRGNDSLVRSSRAGDALYRRVYQQFDVVFAHYESNRRALQETFGLDPRRVVAIVHGNELVFERLRDPRQTASGLRRELKLEPDRPVLLLLGTLARYKGAETMIEALPAVLASHPRACFVIAGFPGEDFDLPGCQRRAARLGIDRAVRFVPRYIESGAVAAWMELAAVAVFPYREVFQSGAMQTALTFGVPVVATRVGAAAEVVRDGETGLLVATGDRPALAQAVTRLLAEPELAARLGAAAAADARCRHSWTGVAQTMLVEYRRLVEARS
jgi:glycosyltransferase involved in cell wall biosynthesis